MRSKTKRKGMDVRKFNIMCLTSFLILFCIQYNADIPFEKKAAPGFYDTSEEQSRIMAAPVGQTLRRLENKRKPDAEDEERRKRQKRDAESKEPGHQTKFIPSREAQIQKLKEAESIGRRRKLVLPNAQVGESELEEIVKIGIGSEEAKALVNTAGGNEASGRLLSDYEGGMLEGAKMARTPRTVPLAGTGFEGTTPAHHVAFTPNPLTTPRRDNLAINPERLRVSASKRALQAGFTNLPKPENNFELVVPDEEEGVDGDDMEGEGGISVEDAAQRDARIKKRKEEEERRELARRSEVIKCGLPRPANVDVSAVFEKLNMADDGDGSDEGDGNEDVDRLLITELVQLVHHDSLVYPLPGTTRPGSSAVFTYTPPDDDSLEQASYEIHQELATLLGFPSASPGQVKEGLMKLAKAEADGEGGLGRADWEGSWACIKKKLVYGVKMDKWVDPSELSDAERVEGYSYMLQQKKESMSKEAAKLSKVEKKLGIILGGYQRVGQSLSQKVESGFEKLRDASIALNVFKRLKDGEDGVVGHKRVTTLEEEVGRLEVRERMGQSRYEELGKIREEMVERITELEERVMEFAEGVNEERLREMENGSH
jgi:pre-mRNA-splicing factor CDC5/CEF1